LAGLFKKAGGHTKRRLTPEQEAEIKKWLKNSETFDGKQTNWTIFNFFMRLKRDSTSLSKKQGFGN
jgi:hypothetical protein